MTRRKLFYMPGMISLIILPLILLSYSRSWRQKENWRVVEVDYLGHKPPPRNYLDLRLKGDLLLDNTNIDFARLKIREILTLNDTLNGIHFVFGKEVKYSALVKIFNNMLLDGKPYYANSGNEMWIFNISEVSISKGENREYKMPLTCGTSLSTYVVNDLTRSHGSISVGIISAWCVLIFVSVLKQQKFLRIIRSRI